MGILIGYKGTPEDRRENWQAMLIFKQGAKELLDNPATKEIAIKDKQRFRKFLKNYTKEEKVA